MFFFYILLFTLITICIVSFFCKNSFYLLFNLLLIFVIWAIFFFLFSDFLSLLILLVYSGGIAILFLFTSFVLDTNFFFFKSQKKNSFTSLIFLVLIGLKFIIIFLQNSKMLFYIPETFNLYFFSYKIQIFSHLLYGKYALLLIFVALILLVAMLGSIGSFKRT